MTIALLPACILCEVHVAIVTLIAATASALPFAGGRSITKGLAAISLTLALVIVVLWGQSLWADIAKTWPVGSHFVNVQISPSFIYVSHAYPNPAARANAVGPGGVLRRVDHWVIQPWIPPALLAAGAMLMTLLGFAIRYRAEDEVRCRLRDSLCLQCGYNLTGNTSGTCPECGTPR